MGTRTSYPPGTFSWVDLATTDAAAAKAFYGGLFGWEMEDTDAGGGAVYTVCRVDGDAVCGLYAMSEDTRAEADSPGWISYVSVADAHAAAARAGELGGGTIVDAVDVGEAGRMAVLRDPQGATLAVWQPRARIGAERVNDVGCLCMNELATTDVEGARAFYEGLFGWTVEMLDESPEGVPPMGFARNGGAINASLFDVPDGAPSHWRPCFTVASIEAALERVRELSGRPLLGPVDIGDGDFAMALDPNGARFSLFAGEVDP